MPRWPVSECSGKENETTFCDQNGPIKRNRSYHFLLLFRIFYTSRSPSREEKQGNAGPVCEKWKGEFRSVDRNKWTTFRGNPEYSGRNLSIWLERNFRNRWHNGKHTSCSTNRGWGGGGVETAFWTVSWRNLGTIGSVTWMVPRSTCTSVQNMLGHTYRLFVHLV